jgi:surfactin family lipopeptide synthetase A
MKHHSLQRVITDLVQNCPEKGIGYIQKNGDINFFTYEKTHELALRVLDGLHKQGLGKNDKLIIALDKNEEIIPAFWACFLGGIIPSLMQAPVSYAIQNQPLNKINSAWRILQQPLILLSKKSASPPDSTIQSWKSISFEDVLSNCLATSVAQTNLNDPAFIQFSSGSTGQPKGIVLTNNNVLANIHDISVTNNINPLTVPVNWMPLYHDMGLIGFHLTPLYAQCSQYLIDTVDFIKNPVIWLDTITKLGVDVTAGPVFGQALTLRYLERRKNTLWDFSSVRCFFNGAEPISADIMTRFMDAMGRYGFQETAMIPCYGMAEATLAISMRTKIVPPTVISFCRKTLYHEKLASTCTDNNDCIKLVGVGQAMGNNKVRIVNDDGIALAEREVGQIQIQGRNVTSHFFNPDINRDEVFDGPWLNTGDMGFFFRKELFITGRAKDLIFVNGQNYYAHDLEQAVIEEKNDLFGKIACCAVFDEIRGHDKLLLFIVGPQNKKFAEQYESVRILFNKQLGLQPDEIIPIKSSEMPRTSSGKLQRYKLAESYQQGVFDHYLKF